MKVILEIIQNEQKTFPTGKIEFTFSDDKVCIEIIGTNRKVAVSRSEFMGVIVKGMLLMDSAPSMSSEENNDDA